MPRTLRRMRNRVKHVPQVRVHVNAIETKRGREVAFAAQ